MLKEFFYIRKSDRKAVLALLCVIVIALGIIVFTGRQNDESNALTAADSLLTDSMQKKSYKPYHRVDTIYLKPRYYRYSKSARKDYARDHTQSVSRDSQSTYQPRHKITEGEYVVLNTADTTALMTIPGIGPYYARRIVQYGERLGGYVSVAQLHEVGDLPEGISKYLTIDNPSPRKLNVNSLSLEQLRKHPYLNFYQAKAILDYRRLHGPIKSLNDLRLSKDFPQAAIDRLLPYVEY